MVFFINTLLNRHLTKQFFLHTRHRQITVSRPELASETWVKNKPFTSNFHASTGKNFPIANFFISHDACDHKAIR